MSKVKKKNSKQQEHHTNAELLESPDAIAERLLDTEKFIKRNRIILGVVLGIIVLAIAGYFIYSYMANQQEQEAQEQMFPSPYYIMGDSLDKALKGDGNYPGFLDIAKDYPLSKAANLAHFYAGAAYMKKGDFKNAITELKQFSANDLLVQARAYCLIGDANMELKNLDEAVTYYKKASNYKPNEQFTPGYLMKLALAYELQKKNEEAIKTYDEIITKYDKSSELVNAKKYKARLETMAGK